jgi:hypothetical protein
MKALSYPNAVNLLTLTDTVEMCLVIEYGIGRSDVFNCTLDRGHHMKQTQSSHLIASTGYSTTSRRVLYIGTQSQKNCFVF